MFQSNLNNFGTSHQFERPKSCNINYESSNIVKTRPLSQIAPHNDKTSIISQDKKIAKSQNDALKNSQKEPTDILEKNKVPKNKADIASEQPSHITSIDISPIQQIDEKKAQDEAEKIKADQINKRQQMCEALDKKFNEQCKKHREVLEIHTKSKDVFLEKDKKQYFEINLADESEKLFDNCTEAINTISQSYKNFEKPVSMIEEFCSLSKNNKKGAKITESKNMVLFINDLKMKYKPIQVKIKLINTYFSTMNNAQQILETLIKKNFKPNNQKLLNTNNTAWHPDNYKRVVNKNSIWQKGLALQKKVASAKPIEYNKNSVDCTNPKWYKNLEKSMGIPETKNFQDNQLNLSLLRTKALNSSFEPDSQNFVTPINAEKIRIVQTCDKYTSPSTKESFTAYYEKVEDIDMLCLISCNQNKFMIPKIENLFKGETCLCYYNKELTYVVRICNYLYGDLLFKNLKDQKSFNLFYSMEQKENIETSNEIYQKESYKNSCQLTEFVCNVNLNKSLIMNKSNFIELTKMQNDVLEANCKKFGKNLLTGINLFAFFEASKLNIYNMDKNKEPKCNMNKLCRVMNRINIVKKIYF